MDIYLAGPLGFSVLNEIIYNNIKNEIDNVGHYINDPWNLHPKLNRELLRIKDLPYGKKKKKAYQKINKKIAEENIKKIIDSDIVIAFLDGPDVDSGTASEIGYALCLGKLIFGIRTDSRLTGDNEGAIVNLQVQYFIENSGGRILNTLDDLYKLLKKY